MRHLIWEQIIVVFLLRLPVNQDIFVLLMLFHVLCDWEKVWSRMVLNTQAMDRTIEALKICHLKLKQRRIKRYRLVATEVCRSTQNGRYFIQRVLDETGLELEIVDRKTEARFAVSGCGTLVEPNIDAIVLFDIGGGSSEIVLP